MRSSSPLAAGAVVSEASRASKAETSPRPKGNGAGRDPNGAYARAALENECDAVASAVEGKRNDTLNRASFNLHQLVAGGELDEDEVVSRLTRRGRSVRPGRGGRRQVGGRNNRQRRRAGREQPRHAPEQDDDASEDADEETDEPESKTKGNGSGHTGTGNSGAKAPPQGRHVELVRASGVIQRPIEWIWKPRLARAKLALLAGDPGVGKSSVTADIIARASNARPWPDNCGFAPAGYCVVLSAEDAADDTICPRLGPPAPTWISVLIMRMAGKLGAKSSFSLATDLPLLATAVAQIGNVVLLCIDPISA